MQRQRAADEEIQRNYDRVKGEDLDRLPMSEERIEQLIGMAESLIDLLQPDQTPQTMRTE